MKRTKDILLLVSAFLLVIIAVMGWHWTDTANTSFWWNFWIVAAIVSFIACLVGWIIINNKMKK